MWIPRKWSDLEAAIGAVEEGSQLDLKREIGSNNEIAKDVASFTIDGGVIVYGVAENSQSGVAEAIHPVALGGTPERLVQVVQSSVSPMPDLTIETIRREPGDDDGVVVVVVRPSLLVPHMAGNRFPARADRTTRWLSEVEVARMYEQRRQELTVRDEIPMLANFRVPEGGYSLGSGMSGFGIMRVAVSAVGGFRHPNGPRVGLALSQAAEAAARRSAERLPQYGPHAWEYLHAWSPRGTVGWKAGEAVGNGTADPADITRVAATYDYSGMFSFQVSMGLTEPDGARYAFEHLWASELTFLLGMAGVFFGNGVGRCMVDVNLSGLENATSSMRNDSRRAVRSSVPFTDGSYEERTHVSAVELASEPDTVAESLLDRMLVPLMGEWDLFSGLRGGAYV